MRSVLVDTSFWYSYLNRTDSLYGRAGELWEREPLPRAVTRPCIAELVTMISHDADPRQAARFGRAFLAGQFARVVDVTPADEEGAFALMESHPGTRLSYADATACAVVRRLDIPRVLAFDSDFKIVLPEREVVGPA